LCRGGRNDHRIASTNGQRTQRLLMVHASAFAGQRAIKRLVREIESASITLSPAHNQAQGALTRMISHGAG
jgi:hypothetical protein